MAALKAASQGLGVNASDRDRNSDPLKLTRRPTHTLASGNTDYVQISHTNIFGWAIGHQVGDGNNNVLLDDYSSAASSCNKFTGKLEQLKAAATAPRMNRERTLAKYHKILAT
jgi:hypothetical protein